MGSTSACGGTFCSVAVPDYGETMDWDTGGSGDEKRAKVAEARMRLDHT